jgi:hypothetical protein
MEATQASEGKASFFEKKEAKKLFYAGSWALSPTTPMTQHKKRPLSSI